MFYPERMSKVTIAAPKVHINTVINTLYEMKALHIQEYAPRNQSDFPIGFPLKDAEKISELLLDIHLLKKLLPSKGKKRIDKNLRKISTLVKKIKSHADEISNKIKEIDYTINEQSKILEELEFLSKCGINNPKVLGEYKTLQMLSGYLNSPEKLKVDEAIIFSNKSETPVPVVIFFKKENRAILKALEKAKFIECKLKIKPEANVKKSLEESRKKLEKLNEEKKKLLVELEDLGKKYGPVINGIEENLLSMIECAEAPLKFALSEYVFIVQGWVPERNTEILMKKIKEINPNIYLKIEKAEKAPTKMKNPNAIKSFEFFINLYSLPKYDEIDPTFLIFLTFPLFYGMMLGDIGYGLVLLLVASILRYKVKKIRALADVTILSAVSTIIFGFIFGEFFGAGEFLGYKLHPYFHRLENVNQLIVISALLGFVHINIGIVLGFINEFKSHGVVKALTAKLSWILFEIGLILFGLNQFNYLRIDPIIPAAIILVSILGLLKGEGFRGIIEIPSLIANVLSYLRITAIGLASASLAIVVNKMAGGLFSAGGFMIALGIFVLVVGHTINLALGIIDSFLQSLRLHYVELFTKFYHGEGKPYKPFGEKR